MGDACEKCGQVHNPRKCTGHKSIRDAETRELLRIEPCGKYPRRGLTVCDSHGGKAPQNQAKAAERVAAEQAQRRIGRPPDPAVAQRREQAIKLRMAGVRYEDIARQLGYASRGAAACDVQRALASTIAEPSEEMRALEVQRLDMLWQNAMKVLSRHHVTVSNGKVVTLDGEPVKDDGPVLQAIDRLLRIQERRAKLLGLDAPAKHEVVTLDAIDAQIRALTEELERADAAAAELDGTEAGETSGAQAASG